MEQQQKKILKKLDLMTSLTVNFPGVLSEAVASSLINAVEKEAISNHYHSIDEKLKTLYLLASGKSTDAFERLIEVLEKTGNNKVASILLGAEEDSDDKMDENHRTLILNNLDRLSSHTMNLPMVFSFASGLELITGKEREVIMDSVSCTNEQFSEFFKLTTEKGPKAYSKLINVLKMTHNNWALDVLHYNETDEADDIIDH